MSLRFRKIFRRGPFRTTMSKKGLGYSFGFFGFRFGISPDGRKYISIGIPNTGLYWIKYFRNKNQNPVQERNVSSMNSKKENTPWWKQSNINK